MLAATPVYGSGKSAAELVKKAKGCDLVVVGVLKDLKLIAFFDSGNGNYLGSTREEASRNTSDGFAVALKCGRISATEVLFSSLQQDCKNGVSVNWYDIVSLKSDVSDREVGSMCPHVSFEAASGKPRLWALSCGDARYQTLGDAALLGVNLEEVRETILKHAKRLPSSPDPFSE